MTPVSVPSPGVAISREFLRRAFPRDDWVATFLKAYDTGRVAQRVGPVSDFWQGHWLGWLRMMNHCRFNIYVSVNAMTPYRRERTKAAVRGIRHVFVDVDRGGRAVLSRVLDDPTLPIPSYVIHTSPGRVQLLWRVRGFFPDETERLQKHLAEVLGGDPCATSVSQTMRLPGFENWKYRTRQLVSVEYGADVHYFEPGDFPRPGARPNPPARPAAGSPRPPGRGGDPVERARRYLAAVPPAIAGQGGDARTFRVCCRLVRGFALDAAAALDVLREWNVRCQPPCSETEMMAKLEHARRYGREPVGGLLGPAA